MPSFKWSLLPLLLLAATTLHAADAPAVTTPTVCAHRGWLSTTQLENSIPQMEITATAGIPWVEMDLATSKDGSLYMLHDRTLDRTTTASGLISQTSDAELTRIYLRNGANISNQRIPYFAQFIGWMRTNNVHVLVDLKTGSPARAASMLSTAGLLDRVIFLSFDPDTDARAFAADPKVVVSLLVKTTADVDAALAKAQDHPIALYVPQGAAPELYQYAAKTGKPVISDAMDKLDVQAEKDGPAVYLDYLKARPISILVTNRAVQLREALLPATK